MQSSGEKLTIAEFATRAGISKQRVYQLLNKTLKDYLVIENGRKYIDSTGIEEVEEARKKQGFTKGLTEFEQDLNKALQTIETLEIDLAEQQKQNRSLNNELNEARAALDTIKPQVAAQIIELDHLKKELEKTVNELHRTQADLEATREQRQKAEIRAAAAEAAAEAECRRADSEGKRADAAEQQCRVKDDQAAHSAQTVTALTAALQTAQQQAENLTKALDNSQALQAGQIRLAMQDGEQDLPADQQPKKKRGLFGGLFHKGNKDS